MRRWRPWSDSDGSASLEFITVGVILLVPLVYLVIAVSSIQAAALAVEGAARQAARVYVQSATDAVATEAADHAIEVALSDYGVDASSAEVSITCVPEPRTCLNRMGTVTVTVRIHAPLPLVPDFFDFQSAASVPLQASAADVVSRFWSTG